MTLTADRAYSTIVQFIVFERCRNDRNRNTLTRNERIFPNTPIGTKIA